MFVMYSKAIAIMAVIVGAYGRNNEFMEAIEAGSKALGGGLGLAGLLLVFIVWSIVLIYKKNKCLSVFVSVVKLMM